MKRKSIILLMFFCAISTMLIAQEKKDEYPKTKISGLIFGDYYYNAVRDSAFNPKIPGNAMTGNNALSGKQNENSVQLRRVYFTFDHKASKNVEARFRLEADPSSNLPNNKLSTFVKAAYIKWNYFQGHNVYFGVTGTSMFEAAEDAWGHRFLEKTITDLRGIESSTDFGIALKGKIDSLGKMKYSAMFGEGSGVVPSSVDWYKRYYLNLQYSPILDLDDKNEAAKEFTVSLSADFNEKPTIVNTYYISDGSKGETNLKGDAMDYALFVGYKEKNKYSLGIEFYYTKSRNAFNFIDTANAANSKWIDKNGMGFSIWGSYQINEKFGAAARFDYFEPNNHTSVGAISDKRTYVIAGLTYSPVKKFVVSPNVLVESYEDKFEGVTNSDGTKSNLKYKSSVTPRLTLSYIF